MTKLLTPTKFGKEIRKLRIDKNMTLNEMATKGKMYVTQLSAVETGRRKVTQRAIDKIVSIFALGNSKKENLVQLAYESNKEAQEAIQKILKKYE